MLAMWPGVIRHGTTSEDLIGLTDLIATIADIVGYELPRDTAEDSSSFLSVLRGERLTAPIHEALIHHAYDGMFAVRSGEWKLALGTGSGGFSEPRRYAPLPGEPAGQLYNITDDHRETLNLWRNNPEMVARLMDIVECYRKGPHSQ